MGVKILKTSLAALLMLALGATWALAGPTTISGTMSCYMPERIEFEPAGTRQGASFQAPTVSGANGQIQVQRTARAPEATPAPASATLVLIETQQSSAQSTVFTICAK